MGKKVIGLLGSPLSEGNTAKLLDSALKGAEDAGCTVEKIEVASLDFQSCMEMLFCKDHDTCIMDDDMQQLYPKFKDMDALIISTPIMTMGIPGKLKSMMDRFQVFFMAKYIRKKPFISKELRAKRKGLFISISGMKIPEVFVGAKLTVKAFLNIIDCQYTDELLINDMDTVRDVMAHPALLEAAYQKGYALGKSLTA
ncbi:MAG: flavodoxin family protein [Methanoregula sp.]|nr:flavodoxin family protein [Methanoregula sp.]